MEMGRIDLLRISGCHDDGMDALVALTDWAEIIASRFVRESHNCLAAAIGRIRGTGPGVSFGRIVEDLESRYPIILQRPFEGVSSIAGGVWDLADLLRIETDRALLKLCFDPGTDQLPFHSHDGSERVIFVLGGRGFFHVADGSLSGFSERNVRTIPVRSRDALVFTRGTVHTFSATSEPLTLLSYHRPYVPLEDPRQFTVVESRLSPRDLQHRSANVSCDPAWTLLVEAHKSSAADAGCSE